MSAGTPAPTIDPSTPAPPAGGLARAWPLWGVFCACSWTWVIGMYLPRIMLERHGWAGFLVFAIPNVLGCAAMGFVLRTKAASDRLLNRHRTAGLWFSAITIAYHAYFAIFLATRLLPADGPTPGPGEAFATVTNSGAPEAVLGVAIVAGLALIGGAFASLRDRGWLILTGLTYAISLGVMVILATRPTTLESMPTIDATGPLMALAPIIVAGFLLCPYLDLTFHRAHRAAPGTPAFAVFGVTFAIMLGLTCLLWFQAGPKMTTVALVHLGAQACFTVGAHLRELLAHATTRRAAWCVLPFVAGGSFALVSGTDLEVPFDLQLVGQDTYLRFLGAYGLLFPAYALAFIVPGLRVDPTPRRVIAVLLICLALGPFVEAAFLRLQTAATIPPLAAIVIWTVIRTIRGRSDGEVETGPV